MEFGCNRPSSFRGGRRTDDGACLYYKLPRSLPLRWAKNVSRVTIFNLCKMAGHALCFYQVLWNYLERYQSYRVDTISILKITKGNNSAKNVGGVTVLISARCLVMLYICAMFCEIISNGIKVMERTQMMNCWQTDGWTDGRTDTQNVGEYNIIPYHFLCVCGGGGG